MTNVLIAADDSDHSIRAAKTARALFGDGAHYFVISVVEPASMWWGSDEAMHWGIAYPAFVPPAGAGIAYPLVVGSGDSRDAGHADGRNPLDEAEQTAGNVAAAANIPSATPLGDTGDPAAAILEAATEHQADVIVVGASQAGWLTRLFTRQVADDVLRDTDRAVLVVP